jgi:hypothetical protein
MGNRKKHWPAPPWPRYPLPDPKVTPEHIDHLVQWMNSIIAWGENVRDDILRLEVKVGIDTGDPGDPPPPPWRPKG